MKNSKSPAKGSFQYALTPSNKLIPVSEKSHYFKHRDTPCEMIVKQGYQLDAQQRKVLTLELLISVRGKTVYPSRFLSAGEFFDVSVKSCAIFEGYEGWFEEIRPSVERVMNGYFDIFLAN